MSTKVKPADIVHELTDPIPRHKPDLSDLCPICGPKIEANRVRSQRIGKCHKALVDFGYAGLTIGETAEAYDLAMSRPVTAADGVIAMFVRGFLKEAGIVSDD